MTTTGYLVCAAVLAAGYSLNLLYITIFYHRAVTHRALELRPGLRRFVRYTGNWVTGLDLKAWACMHRLHHADLRRQQLPQRHPDEVFPMRGDDLDVLVSRLEIQHVIDGDHVNGRTQACLQHTQQRRRRLRLL